MAASGDQQETLCKCVQRLRLVFATVAIRPWRWNDLTGIGLKMGLVIAWRIGKLEPWHSEEANLDIHQLCGHFRYTTGNLVIFHTKFLFFQVAMIGIHRRDLNAEMKDLALMASRPRLSMERYFSPKSNRNRVICLVSF